MLLIVNCNLQNSKIENFNVNIKKSIRNSKIDYQIINANDLENLKNIDQYTHLIISGSKASALDNNIWDVNLKNIVHYFINEKKAVLGICYGHQFIIKSILGLNNVRTTQKPEIGLAKINIIQKDNILFHNMNDIYSFVFHYQEVFNLTKDFNVLAKNSNCNIHAYQYKSLPVWGVQFHPEFDSFSSKAILHEVKNLEVISEEAFINDLIKDEDMKQNSIIFENFLNVKP
ncbi:type 1 glutamine amidotransferase [Abyssisolibacter fermentans]|uniref:type 1 glutamine amidotransferase n=1 Tax=Abyssisolibacter fermentans TaxID=1766203 RepID=UPI00082C2E25|nr:gamma-glutamyl-gamma-aminobutyrate hydrolase family protein [Abyssisolibacter fermentans]